jgi:hypothetical protein
MLAKGVVYVQGIAYTFQIHANMDTMWAIPRVTVELLVALHHCLFLERIEFILNCCVMAEESLRQNPRVFPALAPVFRSPSVCWRNNASTCYRGEVEHVQVHFGFGTPLGKFHCHLSHHSAAMVPEKPQHAKSIPSFVMVTDPCYTAAIQWVALNL